MFLVGSVRRRDQPSDVVYAEVVQRSAQLEQHVRVHGPRDARLPVEVRRDVEPRHLLDEELEAGPGVELDGGVVRRPEAVEQSEDHPR